MSNTGLIYHTLIVWKEIVAGTVRAASQAKAGNKLQVEA